MEPKPESPSRSGDLKPQAKQTSCSKATEVLKLPAKINGSSRSPQPAITPLIDCPQGFGAWALREGQKQLSSFPFVLRCLDTHGGL